MNKERCMACDTPHDTAKEPHHFQEGRPHAWVCDDCWMPGTVIPMGSSEVTGGAWVTTDTPDLVNEPPHYKGLVVRVAYESVDHIVEPPNNTDCAWDVRVESIELIEGFGFGFNLGNVVKYLYRSNEKGDRLENLRKCRWYLDREIENG